MRLRLTLVFALLAALCAAGSAFPVVGGTADQSHSYVGAAIQFQTRGGQSGYELCSGFLISPIKFVTAAHCFDPRPTAAPIQVTFDRVDAPAEHVLTALDPVPVTGIAIAPDYCPACGKGGTPLNDVAVLTLGVAQTTRGQAVLAPVGTVDSLGSGEAIDVVGFGWSDVSHKSPTAFGTRQFATTRTASAGVLGDNYVALLTGPGACQGDSGGPDLFGGLVVSLTTFGNGNKDCNGIQYSQRLDLQALQSFLASA
jgi:secreted trypsin-like serine protease